MKIMIRLIYRTAGVLVLFFEVGQLAIFAQCGYTTIPYMYRNSVNGETIGPVNRIFEGSLYAPGIGEYCTADHRDPDGEPYEHSHIPHGFQFTNSENIVITAQMSDWAWDAAKVGYTPVSGSTFETNCFATAAGSPTFTLKIGYTNFTQVSSQCDNTTKVKSYGDENHKIVITGTYTWPEPDSECVISGTKEKDGSSGIYSFGWLPLGTNTEQPVRKRKL